MVKTKKNKNKTSKKKNKTKLRKIKKVNIIRTKGFMLNNQKNKKTIKNIHNFKKGGSLWRSKFSVDDIIKKRNDILEGNLVKNYSDIRESNTINYGTLKTEYNNFAKNLKHYWKTCINKSGEYNSILLDNYDRSIKYKKDNYNKNYTLLAEKSIQDIYDIQKVDNHVHLSAIMTSKELKDYMKSLQQNLNNFDYMYDNEPNITIYKLNTIIDNKDEGEGCEHKFNFNNFNNKYYIGSKPKIDEEKSNKIKSKTEVLDLRSCFLKTAEYNKVIDTGIENHNIFNMGEFNCNQNHYANITKKIAKERLNKNTFLDIRLSIYGGQDNELSKLADWFISNKLNKIKNINWYIQIPRIFHIKAKVKTFEEFINTFKLIFGQFKNGLGSNDDNKVKQFLLCIKGFDSVDNEGEPNEKYYNDIDTKIDETQITKIIKKDQNPFTYAMYLYFMRYFISDLNNDIKDKNKKFTFKPHAGELGPSHHLLTAFLLSDSICHGTNLIDINTAKKYNNAKDIIKNNKNGVLLYLYVNDKVGCSLSPTSNNYLSRSYKCLHLDILFNVGLLMSISTDDPLMFHMTDNPLVEELTIAKNVYNFSLIDIHELIINSHLIRHNIKEIDELRGILSKESLKNLNLELIENYKNKNKNKNFIKNVL